MCLAHFIIYSVHWVKKCDRILEKQSVSEKNKKKFIALLPFTGKIPPSKFEANPTFRLRVKRASFSLFTLASSCSNAYFRAYAIIDFLADRLVFLNTVTNLELQKIGRAYTKEAGSFKCMSNIKLYA